MTQRTTFLPTMAKLVLALLVAPLCGQEPNPSKWGHDTGVAHATQEPGRSTKSLGPSIGSVGRSVGLVRRAVSEKDAISMVLISGPGASSNYGGTLGRDFAVFSPDGSRFLITLKRGNLRNNTTKYSLLLYRTGQILHSPRPMVLVSMSSSSNREAIKDVSWLEDNNTIFFLGEHEGEHTQLYSIQCTTRRARRLTNHPTNLVTYSADSLGRTVVYAAEKPSRNVVDRNHPQYGFHVTDQAMADLIAGQIQDGERELYVLRDGAAVRGLSIPSELAGKLLGPPGEMFLSPDGRNLVVKVNLTVVPDGWREYKDPWLHRGIVQYRPSGAPSWVFRYGIIDLESGQGRILLDSPVSYSGAEVKWSPDSRSVVLSGVYSPLRPDNPSELDVLKTRPLIVEVEVKTLKYSKVADHALKLLGWNRHGDTLVLENTQSEQTGLSERVYYQRRNGYWEEAGGNFRRADETRPEITTEQDLNTAPRIIALSRATGQRVLLLDLNPQFKQLKFGRVEEIRFHGAGDCEVRAGLYLPTEYTPGKRYPLVVQTHGFDPYSFWIDGPYPTAFAAQALASIGIAVLQLPTSHDWVGTPEEAPKMMETFERAIEHVQNRGIVDAGRIGIVGFSRTGLHVHYALTHSPLHFKAAVVADGSDGGYSQYIQFLNASPYTASDSEAINGGLPFGPGISSWLQHSPEFRLDRVQTPLLIQALNPRSLSFQWATFVGLRRLNKPVELLYLPNARHILQKPWDRLASQQGVVDWCAFWLLGREDPDPAKSGQYARWRELRNLQNKNCRSCN